MSERDIVERLRDFNEVARRVMADEARKAGIDPAGESIVDEAIAEIERLRASTPEGSKTQDRTMDGCDPARATYTRAISPPSHDVEALREALEELLPYFEGEHAPDHPSVVKARRALSQHVGGEG